MSHFIYWYAECDYVECGYAECHDASILSLFVTLSTTTHCHNTKRCFDECHILFIVMLDVIMLSVIMLSVMVPTYKAYL